MDFKSKGGAVMEAVVEYIVTRKLAGDTMEQIHAGAKSQWPTITDDEFGESCHLAGERLTEKAEQYRAEADRRQRLRPKNDNQTPGVN